MSIPPTTQRVIIDGDLEIATKPGTTGNTLGRMVFTDKTIGDIGSVKVYGFSSSTFRLINDSAKIGRGASFRTFSSQGGSDEGGTGALYTMDIQNGYIRLGNYSFITPQNYRYPNGDFPGYLFKVEKDQATTGSYAVIDDVQAWFSMRNFLTGQSQTINVGAYSGSGLSMGYRGGASVPYGFIGLSTNSVHSVSEYLKLIPGGIVEAISTLKATTVEASNWVGLPPTPPPDLLPITLDKTNNRVGINQTTPTHDLDVNGTVAANSLLLQTITQTSTPNILMYDTSTKAVSYALASSLAPDLLPITLDKTNNRVGINKIDPAHALHVIGNGYFSGSVTSTSGFLPNGQAAGAAILRAGTGTPEAVVTANVGSLYMRQDGAAGTTLYTKETGTGNTGWVNLSPVKSNNQMRLKSTNTTNAQFTVSNYTIRATGLDIGSQLVSTTITNTGLGISLNNSTGVFTFTRNGKFAISFTSELNDGTVGESNCKSFLIFALNGTGKDSHTGGLVDLGYSVFSTTVYIDITKINQIWFTFIPYHFTTARTFGSYVTICEV